MDPREQSLVSGLGPAWTIVIFAILIVALIAGTIWADRNDRRNPR